MSDLQRNESEHDKAASRDQIARREHWRRSDRDDRGPETRLLPVEERLHVIYERARIEGKSVEEAAALAGYCERDVVYLKALDEGKPHREAAHEAFAAFPEPVTTTSYPDSENPNSGDPHPDDPHGFGFLGEHDRQAKYLAQCEATDGTTPEGEPVTDDQLAAVIAATDAPDEVP